jgi:hypothetical protein
VKHHITRTLLFLTFIPLSGYTSCKYFSTTTVPATDSTPPIAVASLVRGADQLIRFGELIETTHDLNENFIPIGAIYDNGGARSVTMHQSVRVRCRQGSLAQLSIVHFLPISDTQAGSVGSSVSDGIWVGEGFRFSTYAALCNPGFVVEEIRYGWSFSGDNFHGLTASNGGAITYTP